MIPKDMESVISGLVRGLKPVTEVPSDAELCEVVVFDRSETDNTKWIECISEHLKAAKSFEIHCWNEETEWIELALQYGKLKEDPWKCGKIITGEVTSQFAEMLLNLPKPDDTEICNKMTPFFGIFLDKAFSSEHYGSENIIRIVKR